MVFSHTRKQRNKPQRTKRSLNDLPDETILNILEFLPVRDALNLRLTSRYLAGASTDAVAQRCKTIYLHPSKNALKQFFQICAHPILRKYVETLTLLGMDMLFEIHDHYDLYQRMPPFNTAHRTAPMWQGQFRPWPVAVTADPANKIRVDYVHVFGIAYRDVIEAVSSLPRLHRVTLQESVIKNTAEGHFNGVADNIIHAHANKYSRPMKDAKRPPATAGAAAGLWEWQVLVQLCEAIPQAIDKLEIDVPLPFLRVDGPYDLVVDSCLKYINPSNAARNPFRNVAHLDLAVDRLQFDTTTATANRQIIRLASPTLQTLRIRLFGSAFKSYDRPSSRALKSALGVLLDTKQDLRKLQSLEIELPRQSRSNGRVDRPCILYFDPITYLFAHRDTLKNVSFKNIIFSCPIPDPTITAIFKPATQKWIADHPLGPLPPPSGFILGMTTELLGDHLPQLQHCEWHVSRFFHHPHCPKADDEALDYGGDFNCGCYEAVPLLDQLQDFDNTTIVAFDELAERQRAELSGDRTSWDYGKRVREKVRERREGRVGGV